ncbi:unnamed protein product [Zymoseptoria tritici ST99CH_1A5]|uniref:C2H2-type domain-containing protein n=1 Tax=Zymoseptoria tritici ST99CH_1A5 TaxID=1276529 RepID=A0A1Y6LJ23_ZYMTR|nr:unnamed protein product [Zymoseptoria tritici ST99CH_1A5]
MNLRCNHCGNRFTRKDILSRHIQTQHKAAHATISCGLCGKQVRPRSVPAHLASDSCKRSRSNTDIDIDIDVLAVARGWNFDLDELDGMFSGDIFVSNGPTTNISTPPLSRQRQAKYMPTPNYLPAVADPVLLSAWLFIKLKPWGSAHRWADPDPLRLATTPLRAFSKPSVDILELRALVFRTLRKALTTPNTLDRDPYFPDALIMLVLFTCQTEGWAAAIPHGEPLLWLAERYLKGIGSRECYKSTIAGDAFGTVLSRYVKNKYAEPLQRMFTMAQRVMRQTVIDLIDGPFEHFQVPVWRRPYLLRDEDWFVNYEDQLRPIIHLADSIPDNIEKPSAVKA